MEDSAEDLQPTRDWETLDLLKQKQDKKSNLYWLFELSANLKDGVQKKTRNKYFDSNDF